MSGLDPLARGLVNTDAFDPGVAELAIPARAVAALRAALAPGELASVRVMPPSGGSDYLDIAGQQVPAVLPPSVRPGDTLIIEVVAFEGDRVFVRNLGIRQNQDSPPTGAGSIFVDDLSDDADPAAYSRRSGLGNPLVAGPDGAAAIASDAGAGELLETMVSERLLGGPAVYGPPAPVATATGPLLSTPVYFLPTGNAASAAVPGAGALPPPGVMPPGIGLGGAMPAAVDVAEEIVARPPPLPGGSPPSAVFVAALVLPSEPRSNGNAAAVPRSGGAMPPPTDPSSPVEAKIAAARAAPPPSGTLAGPPLSAPGPERGRLAPAGPLGARVGAGTSPWTPSGRLPGTPVSQSAAAAQLAQRAAVLPRAAPAATLPVAEGPAAEAPAAEAPAGNAPAPNAPAAETSAAKAPAASVRTAPRGAAAFSEPAALVRALRLPVTPTNVAAARLALSRPQALPEALSALERALPEGGADPRVVSLKTIAAFVTRLDPDSPHFAQQLAAYVEHLVEGPEPKLAALLTALAQADDEASAATLEAPAPPEAAALSSPAPLGEDAVAEPPAEGTSALPNAAVKAASAESVFPTPDVPPGTSPSLAATIVAKALALASDLKTQLQSLLAAPPPASTEQQAGAVQSALTALTAAQLSAALAGQQDPAHVVVAIPLPFAGGRPAQLKIARDPPQGATKLDGDNFHIAFVLDTESLGTVAIDLQTVGRAASLKVHAETARAASRFQSSLGELGERLEQLRYRVAGMQADVAPRAPLQAAAPPAVEPEPEAAALEPTHGLDRHA